MLEFTLSEGKIVLSKEIVLFKELETVYNLKDGEKLLLSISYMHSRSMQNPFRDLDFRVKETNVFMAVFKVKNFEALKLSKVNIKKYKEAEEVFKFYNTTAEGRMSASINRKFDELAILMDETVPTIEESVTKSGEVKYNSNLTIILNLFSKLDVIMKARSTLETAILKNESAGRLRGGGRSSFRESGTFK